MIYHQWECSYFQLYLYFHLAAQQAASATAFCPLKFSLVSLTLIQCVTTLLGRQSSLLSYLFEDSLTKIKVRRLPSHPSPLWEMGLNSIALVKEILSLITTYLLPFPTSLTSWRQMVRLQ